jgi:hypothetical protein
MRGGRRLRLLAQRLGIHVARTDGYQLVKRDYYSPIPDDPELAGLEDRRSALEGIELDLDDQLDWAKRQLGPYLREFADSDLAAGRGRFKLENRYYEQGDADLAYAMIRHLKPARLLELGSGHSTLVLAGACAANAADGRAADYRTFNPHPPEWLERDPPAELTGSERMRAQDVSLRLFDDLGAGDVLFVDTSHTVKVGGDVNRIVLEVLPRLAAGVVVHFHDIWLPYEYHRVLVEEMGMAWAEQYLLQAYLSENPNWRLLFATQALAREREAELRRLLPTYEGENFPSSFWIGRA